MTKKGYKYYCGIELGYNDQIQKAVFHTRTSGRRKYKGYDLPAEQIGMASIVELGNVEKLYSILNKSRPDEISCTCSVYGAEELLKALSDRIPGKTKFEMIPRTRHEELINQAVIFYSRMNELGRYVMPPRLDKNMAPFVDLLDELDEYVRPSGFLKDDTWPKPMPDEDSKEDGGFIRIPDGYGGFVNIPRPIVYPNTSRPAGYSNTSRPADSKDRIIEVLTRPDSDYYHIIAKQMETYIQLGKGGKRILTNISELRSDMLFTWAISLVSASNNYKRPDDDKKDRGGGDRSNVNGGYDSPGPSHVGGPWSDPPSRFPPFPAGGYNPSGDTGPHVGKWWRL